MFCGRSVPTYTVEEIPTEIKNVSLFRSTVKICPPIPTNTNNTITTTTKNNKDNNSSNNNCDSNNSDSNNSNISRERSADLSSTFQDLCLSDPSEVPLPTGKVATLFSRGSTDEAALALEVERKDSTTGGGTLAINEDVSSRTFAIDGSAFSKGTSGVPGCTSSAPLEVERLMAMPKTTSDRFSRKIADNTVADVLEALFAVHYLDSNANMVTPIPLSYSCHTPHTLSILIS